ncbi:hypothetical protein LTR04_005408 [Oleoguttula sp. CCFEE 6159]|nr:hypothetical protein LTR04_005408 [Oleoguttula sp. CCFEE 6159]
MLSLFSATLLLLASLSHTTLADQLPLSSSTLIGSIPHLGFGTWNLKVSHSNTSDAVSAAIQAGYRHIDCAAAYGNQKDVGRGIKEGMKKVGLKREDLWITSKLWNDQYGFTSFVKGVEEGLNETLRELGMDYLDLYLMHWPVGNAPDGTLDYDYVQTWRAMEYLPSTGKVLNIGISNFSPTQLRELMHSASIKPAVHQMEMHPYLQQVDWLMHHRRHGIHVTAYSPLGNSNPTYSPDSTDLPPPLLQNKEILAIAEKANCTAAQVALAWGRSRGTSVIPKSSHVSRIEENYGAKTCILWSDDTKRIEALGEKYLHRFNNPSKGWGVDLFEGLDGV